MSNPITRIARAAARRRRLRRAIEHLEQMSDYLLADVGLSRPDIEDVARGRLPRRDP
jgi:uncharacterized protein YjiS (DUF1127 family)